MNIQPISKNQNRQQNFGFLSPHDAKSSDALISAVSKFRRDSVIVQDYFEAVRLADNIPKELNLEVRDKGYLVGAAYYFDDAMSHPRELLSRTTNMLKAHIKDN